MILWVKSAAGDQRVRVNMIQGTIEGTDESVVVAPHEVVGLEISDSLRREIQTQKVYPREEAGGFAKSFSVKVNNIMATAGITTWSGLMKWSADDLLRVRNCGEKAVEEIQGHMRLSGLALSTDSHRYARWLVGEQDWAKD